MSNLEYKSLGGFEMKDMDKDRRTAVIAHAVYNVIDNYSPVPDIARRGMFNKTWMESKAKGVNKTLGFYINHDPQRQPGTVSDVWDDEQKAYTKVNFGSHTLGQDTMIMMDEGIIRDASFSFKALQKNYIEVKGRKVRELKEVIHGETSVVIGIPPVNPLAGVVSVTKADIGALEQFKAHVLRLEGFCRNTTASDESIIAIMGEVKAAREILSQYDTAFTPLITEPDASRNDSFYKQLLLLNMQLS